MRDLAAAWVTTPRASVHALVASRSRHAWTTWWIPRFTVTGMVVAAQSIRF